MAVGIGDFIKDVFASTGATLTYSDIIVALLVTLVMSLSIFYVYKKTYSGVLYSKNFNVTLVVVSLVVCVIMMGISRNLALSLGLIGALSIVRFRNAIKDSKDVAFLFWSISIGIINGVQFYKLSITATIFIGIVIVMLCKKIVLNNPYLLILKGRDLDEGKVFLTLKKYCSRSQIRNRVLSDTENELTVEVKLKDKDHKAMLEAVKKVKGVESINMVSYEGDLFE